MIRSLKNLGAIFTKLYFLAAPYSRRKPLIVLAVTLAQGFFQVVGVTSIFPFLAIASDPEAFRGSRLGETLLGMLPVMSDAALLVTAGLFSIAMLVAANASNLASDYVRARYAQGLAHWLRLRLLSQIVSQPWSYFLRNNTGVLLKKTTSDVMQMTIGVLFPALEGFARFVTLLFLGVTLILIDPWIAIGAMVVLLLYYASVFTYLKSRYARASDDQKEAYRGAMTEAQQLLGGIKPIKIQHAEGLFLERFANHSRTQARVNVRLPIYYQAPKYILEPIAFGGIIAVVTIQAAMGRDFASILPTLGVIGLAGYRMLPAAQIFYAQISQVATSRHHLEEVYDEFQQQHLIVKGKTVPSPSFDPPKPLTWSRDIRLDDLTFAYPETKKPVIERFSLTIPRNASVGIIGPTGCGKSTLVDLILGLHQPTSGAILVDGQPLDRGNIRAWQLGIGYVPQDIFLIDDTIARNIALGVPDREIDQAALRSAAAAASILEFIEKDLPDGFNSVVGERGVRLSGGQRQRIVLARAIYRRPELLILDEATSALDTETEAQVVEAINNLQGEVTMIVIAHRLSTIEKCQTVVTLEHSRAMVSNQKELIAPATVR
jgi:ABC-type multidrug transport system fused ATPase/permease subunit